MVSEQQVDLAAFAGEHSLGLARFAYLLCGDHAQAQDLVQEALLGMYRRFGETVTVAAPVAYARKAVLNAHLSRRRLRSSRESVVAAPPDRAINDPDGADRDAMWQALRTLPGRQCAVLVLRYYVDLSDSEIAQALGCHEGTVRSLATRAFAALRQHPDLPGGNP